jgi:hypothetical protein
MNELSEILEEKGRQVLEIEVDGRGRRGRRRRLDRRPRKVQIEAAELRDPVSDRLHHRRLTRAGATSRDGASTSQSGKLDRGHPLPDRVRRSRRLSGP